MTEKRFGVITNWCVYENVDGVEKWLTFDETVTILNQLNYENEQLKEELEQCKAVIEKRWSEYLQKKELKNE